MVTREAYYNEHDPGAAEWLRELIKAGLIAPGDVDERSIEDVVPDELVGYTQCHFFAGIGVWSYALRLAGWPDDRPVWTGSCPCQPFSAAGKRAGVADERHLWPALHHLIRCCRPDTFFGEQVASRDGLGWFDVVSADLEGEAYTCRAADLCVAGFGAPHIRQRLWFVADTRRQPVRGGAGRDETPEWGARAAPAGPSGLGDMADRADRRRDWRKCSWRGGARPADSSNVGDMADSGCDTRCSEHEYESGQESWGDSAPLDTLRVGPGFDVGELEDADGGIAGNGGIQRGGQHGLFAVGDGFDGMANDYLPSTSRLGRNGGQGQASHGLRGRPGHGGESDRMGHGVGSGLAVGERDGRLERGALGSSAGKAAQCGGHAVPIERPGPLNGVWRDADWLLCRDGWWRPVASSTFPLAHGVAGRVGLLRGYGNAISPEPAAAWIGARLAEEAGQGKGGGAGLTMDARNRNKACTACGPIWDGGSTVGMTDIAGWQRENRG